MLNLKSTICALVIAFLASCASTESKIPQHEATMAVPKNAVWWQDTHKQINEEIAKGKVDLLFVGDSITHWFRKMPWQNEQTCGMTVWKDYYEKRNAANTGIMGDKTQHVLWRLQNGNLKNIQPKLAVIMIGTNNVGSEESAEQTVDGITAIIEFIHQNCPNTKVLLLGIFPRGKEIDNKARLQNEKVNKIISGYDKIYPFLTYLDIGKSFLKANGSLDESLMPDYLHPNAKGYKVWAEAMEPTIEKLMK